MAYLIGTDEAGYGPNLGPLVVAATAWQVPEPIAPEAMYDALGEVVCQGATKPEDCRLAIADSKQLYKPGSGLSLLERGVLTALALVGRRAQCWREIWPCLDDRPADAAHMRFWNSDPGNCDPWYEDYDEPLPIDTPGDELESAADLVQRGCEARQVRLVGVQAAVLAPGEFNDQVKKCGNKAEVLSLTTLALARRLIEAAPASDVQVLCDRHGGRAYYAALLQHIFPDEFVLVRRETPALGVYELKFGERRVEFQFLVGGERMLPTALASMTAKYLRELAMRPFNAFWQRHVPGLRATAGYPGDAQRFWDEIRSVQRKLKIADRELWRKR